MIPENVSHHLRQLGADAAELAAARPFSLCDGADEIALIVRAGGMIALCDLTRSTVRIYDQNTRPLRAVPLFANPHVRKGIPAVEGN